MSEDTVIINQDVMLPVGTLLQGGKYRIERYLSSGGFGNTYVVTNMYFEETYAMKEFFMKDINLRSGNTVTVSMVDKRQTFEAQRDKFLKEARRLRKLHNEHLVQVHDLFEENGTAYYVMDFIKGETMKARLNRLGRPLTEDEVMPLLHQALDVLQVVHREQIWHLDIKPDNIMVDENGKLYLIDFGASKQLHSVDGQTLDTTTAMALTKGYAPIEQMEQNLRFCGPWTDLYALGATLYKLLTNQTPPSASEMQMFSTPLLLPTSVSVKTQQLIGWMMRPRLDERPQSVADVQRFLVNKPAFDEAGQVKRTEPVSERTEKVKKPQTLPDPQPLPTPKPQPNIKLLIGIGACVIAAVVAAVIAGLVFFTNRQENVVSITEEVEIVPRADEVITVNGVSFKMIGVQGGTFTMGATSEQGSDADSDEKPTHQVTLSSFSIGETEVTQELWQAVMGSNPSYFKGLKRPVEQVNWEDCQAFIRELNNLTGRNFRLPTEAEWEYAARGGQKSNPTKYAGSSTIDDVAWYIDNSGDQTHDVATKRANELGLYDMSGNVWEWCQDWKGSYRSGSQTTPKGASSGSDRVYRGGSWNYGAWFCRVSIRYNGTPASRYINLGLRLAF